MESCTYEDQSTDLVSTDALQRRTVKKHPTRRVALEMVFDVALASFMVAWAVWARWPVFHAGVSSSTWIQFPLRGEPARARVVLSADAADLLRVMARLLEGMPTVKAFGAPGDWGYETELGQAVIALRQGTCAAEVPQNA